MKALAQWHCGGGRDYCDGCREMGLACAHGGLSESGEACPYRARRPQSLEGQQIWDLFLRAGSQLRTAGLGAVIGLDYSAVFAVADALGLKRVLVAELMPYCEAGLIAALQTKEDE